MPRGRGAAARPAGRRRARRRSPRCSCALAADGERAMSADAARRPAGRRPRGEPARAAGGARAAAVPAGLGHLRRGGAEGAAARGLRGRAARRADAGHGRLRDRRADQGPRAHAHAADHLRDGDQQGAPPRLPRLLGRRRRLRLQALRPGDPALQGRGLPRARREVARRRAQRGDPARGVRRRADRHGAAGPRGPRRRGQPRARRAARPRGPPTCATGCSTTSCTPTTRPPTPTGARAARRRPRRYEHEARLVDGRRRGDPVRG